MGALNPPVDQTALSAARAGLTNPGTPRTLGTAQAFDFTTGYTNGTSLTSISPWQKSGSAPNTTVQISGATLAFSDSGGLETLWYLEQSNRIHYAEANCTSAGSSTHFPCVIRAADANNFVGIRANTTTHNVEVFQRVAGTFTSLATYAIGSANRPAGRLRLEVSGDDTVSAYYAGMLLGTVTCPAALTNNTKVGVVARSSTAAITDFHAYAGVPVHGLASGVWCWFTEPRAVSANGKTWFGTNTIGSLNNTGDGIVQITQVDNTTGATSTYALKHASGFGDDHCHPSICLRTDGRIVCFYSGHIDSAGIRYRVSVNAYDISGGFSAEQTFGATDATTNPVSYASSFILTGESNKCYVLFRRNIDVGFYTSTDLNSLTAPASDGAAITAATWSSAATWVTCTGAKGVYVKAWSNNLDRIDLAMTDAINPDHGTKLNICHAYWKNGALRQSNGQSITTPVASTGTTIVAASGSPDNLGDVWVHDCYRNAVNGRVYIVFAQFVSQTDHRYWYAWWDGQQWLKYQLPLTSGSLTVYNTTGTTGSGAETYYSPGIALDAGAEGVVYAAVGDVASTVSEMRRYVTADGGASWTYQVISGNVITNDVYSGKNFRPTVPRGRDARVAVLWCRGAYEFYVPGATLPDGMGYHCDVTHAKL